MSEMAKSENSNEFNNNETDECAGSRSIVVNGSGTPEQIGTGLTQPRSRPVRRTWTYFIRGADAIKIGRSGHPETRMSDLQGASPSRLELLLKVPETILAEGEAHATFKHLRMHGEWFQPAPDLLDFIEGLKAKGPYRLTRARKARLPASAAAGKIITDLLAVRKAHGFNSPAGRRCSNLAEMLPIFETATDPLQKAALAANIQRQMSDLAGLRTGLSH